MPKSKTVIEEYNIRFVRTIEKYPILYDKIIEGYSQKDEVNDAWNEVSKSMKISVAECQKKWNTLCEGISNYLHDNENIAKKWHKFSYLTAHVKFIAPFVKKRKINSVVDKKTAKSKSNSDSDNDDIDSVDDDEVPKHTEDLDKLRKAKQKQKKNGYHDINHNNPDMCFLHSLLPDLELMTTRQKQEFKIGVLKLINDVEQHDGNQTEMETNQDFGLPIHKEELIIKQEQIG